MSLIEEIEAKLLNRPGVKYEIENKRITVLPATDGGFRVALFEGGPDWYQVYFNDWHEDFTERRRALKYFELGLSDQCRLREYFRGDKAYKWVLEVKTAEGWVRRSVTAQIFFPFWKRRRIETLRNDLLGVNSPT